MASGNLFGELKFRRKWRIYFGKLAYLFHRNVLPKCVRLRDKGVNCLTNCAMCVDAEDHFHMLFLCLKRIYCWQKIGMWSSMQSHLNYNKSIAKTFL
jgi:hypothetical protein